MNVYLNAGFGEKIGLANLRLFASLGFKGIRQDVPSGRSRELVAEFANFRGLAPLFLISGGKMLDYEIAPVVAWAVAACMKELGCGGAIEIGNEPDITGIPPAQFAALVTESARGVWAVDKDIPVVSGGIMSTNERGLDYLADVLEAGLPAEVIIGYHTYRQGSPDEPNDGFHNRSAEFHRLRNVVGSRNIWCTEVGWSDAPFKTRRDFPFCWIPKTEQFSEEEVFRFLVRERELNKQAGAEVFVVYQANDGPGDEPGDHFGIRRLDGSLKPSAHIARA